MLTLHMPTPDEWEYRQKLYLDVDSTIHNAPYGDNGIDGVWFMSEEWLRRWLASINTCDCVGDYYAYILLDGEPIGEVMAIPKNDNLIGIVIHAQHRGKGYGKAALTLLCDKLFMEFGYEYITDEFSTERIAADKIFRDHGFERIGDRLILTREKYIQMQME